MAKAVTETERPRDYRVLARRYRSTSLEGGSRLYDACVFSGSLVSKRLCVRRWQCYRCPFYDQITYEADMRKIQKAIKTGETEKVATKMKPILIVEDETIMRESLRDWLRDDGYEVETAEEAEGALQQIGEKEFGVVVLDLRLPGKDGLEVFKEAKARRTQLKGIIITAYPSVETAVEAMKIGAVDYLTKPFDLNDLEKLIRDTLGPVQVEIKPKVIIKEALTKPRVEVVTKGEAAPVAEEVKPKECLWMRMGVVTYHLCTTNYDCLTCEFDQMMRDKIASGEAAEFDEALERLKELPANQRLCHYALKRDASYLLCTDLFQCSTCEFGQMTEDAVQQKLAKLAKRREALRKKKQKTEAKA